MRSVALDTALAGRELYEALRLLRQDPPAQLELEQAPTVLQWACAHWRPEQFRGVQQVRAAS
jgi:hypothetical protein